MKRLPLSQGKFALVDDEDYDRLAVHKWSCTRGGYAVRRRRAHEPKTTPPMIYMHHIIIERPAGSQIDHINRDRLDNQRANLRAVAPILNSANTVYKRPNKSGGIAGVLAHKGGWITRISIDGKQIYLGWDKSKEKIIKCRRAAEVYRDSKYATYQGAT